MIDKVKELFEALKALEKPSRKDLRLKDQLAYYLKGHNELEKQNRGSRGDSELRKRFAQKAREENILRLDMQEVIAMREENLAKDRKERAEELKEAVQEVEEMDDDKQVLATSEQKPKRRRRTTKKKDSE